jgi:hypothetical protein
MNISFGWEEFFIRIRTVPLPKEVDYFSLLSSAFLYLSPCSYSSLSSIFYPSSISSLTSTPSLSFSASLGQAPHPQTQNHLRIILRSPIKSLVFEQVWQEAEVGAELCSTF